MGKVAVRLIVGRYDGEESAVVAGCLDAGLYDVVGDEDWQRWTREIQVRFAGDTWRDYEWREVEAHFEQAPLDALFDAPPVVGEIVG